MEAKRTCQTTEFANECNYYDATSEFTEFNNKWTPNEHVKSPNIQLGRTSVIELPNPHKLGSE